jgi:hypothetical protein
VYRHLHGFVVFDAAFEHNGDTFVELIPHVVIALDSADAMNGIRLAEPK